MDVTSSQASTATGTGTSDKIEQAFGGGGHGSFESNARPDPATLQGV